MKNLIKKKLWEDANQKIRIDIEYLKDKNEITMTELDMSNVMYIAPEDILLKDVNKIDVSEEQEEQFNSDMSINTSNVIKDHCDDYSPCLTADDFSSIDLLDIKKFTLKEVLRIRKVDRFLYKYVPVSILKDIKIISPESIEGSTNFIIDEAKQCGAKVILAYMPNNIDQFNFTTNVSAKGIEDLITDIKYNFKQILDWEEYDIFNKSLEFGISEMLYEASTEYSDINIFDSDISLNGMISCYSKMGEKLMSYVNGERIISNFLDLLIYDDEFDHTARHINYLYNDLIWSGVAYNKVVFIQGVCNNHVRVIIYDNTISKDLYDSDDKYYSESNIVDKADIEYGEDIIENITEYIKKVYTAQYDKIRLNDIE